MFKQSFTLCNERGIALVAALVIMAMLMLLGTVALNSTVSELQVSGNDNRNRLAFYAAESGVEFARAQIRDAFVTAKDAGTDAAFVADFEDSPPNFTPPTGYDFTITPLPIPSGGSGTAADPYCFKIKSVGNAAGNASAGIEVEFHLVVISYPFKYAAYGKDHVTLFGTSVVDAYDSDTGDPAPGEANVFSEGLVTVKPNATVDGPEPTSFGDDSDDPLGLLTPGGDLDLAFTAAKDDNDAFDDDNNPIGPLAGYLTGTDGTDLSVDAATTILLPPGDYYFTSIEFKHAVTLDIDTSAGAGKVNIYLDGPLTIKEGADINTAGLPSDFSIYSKASDVADDEAAPSPSIDLKHEVNINGVIYAPDADIVSHNSGSIKGALFGYSVELKSEAELHWDKQLGDDDDDVVPITIASWLEI
ncbi:MAG: pilus assembly PilX N-terminal domain-containing protein [Desulfuromonadaceae bacterium]